jgi:hypothetical protein
MIECRKALGKQLDLASGNSVKPKKKTVQSGNKLAVSQLRRRVIADSDDEDGVASSTPSSPSREKKRTMSPAIHSVKRQRDSSSPSCDSSDDQSVKRTKRPRQGLAAELDDLDIDMEGWSAAEDAPRRLRRRY